MEEEKLSLYRAARTIKRRENSLYNALRSIYDDSIFVGEIAQVWPELPLVANLRCGLWYSPKFDATCYFKSTDGHTNNLSFNTSRLNLHLAVLAGQRGGCIIVDSTRKGKRFPDSMSKTIPIWTCVLNRAIFNCRKRMNQVSGFIFRGNRFLKEYLTDKVLTPVKLMKSQSDSDDFENKSENTTQNDWNCTLHLPLWIPSTEKIAIEQHINKWTDQLEASGADITSLTSFLKKPLRPLWVSQRTVIWLNEVPDPDSLDFTPIILVSSSSADGVCQHCQNSEFGWNYISGAGDDEESWARGLSPNLFWNNVYDIINAEPDYCNQKVADIVEKDRVYRAHRGLDAPQVLVRGMNFSGESDLGDPVVENGENTVSGGCDLFWLGSSKVAVCASRHAENAPQVDCILNCDTDLVSSNLENPEAYLHLPIQNVKFDRFSLLRNLPSAVNFAGFNLRSGKSLLVCCNTGEDISICICLAILTSLFTVDGFFDDGKSFKEMRIFSKLEMRHRLIYICKYAINARPSRGNLRQVYNFLLGSNSIDNDE